MEKKGGCGSAPSAYSLTMTFIIATTPVWSFRSKAKVPKALISLTRAIFVLSTSSLYWFFSGLGDLLGGDGSEELARRRRPWR